MTQLADIPPSTITLENETYGSADEWYEALANMHLAQLIFQHDDLVLGRFSEQVRLSLAIPKTSKTRSAIKYSDSSKDDWSVSSSIQIGSHSPLVR